MSDDESHKSKADILKSRGEFPGWKRRMEMVAQSRGDTEGIFSDRGQNPLVGYQLIPIGAAGNNRRKEWNELSIKLSGKVGGKIENAALFRIWSDAQQAANAAPAAGQPDRRPYRFADSMRALEQECARESESGNGLARGAFTLALQSFGMHKGKSADSGSSSCTSSRRRRSGPRCSRSGTRTRRSLLTTS